MNICGIDPSTSAPTAGTFTWTYTSSGCTNPWTIEIERAVPVVSAGVNAMCTRVKLNYPYAWDFGSAGMLLGANSYTTTIS